MIRLRNKSGLLWAIPVLIACLLPLVAWRVLRRSDFRDGLPPNPNGSTATAAGGSPETNTENELALPEAERGYIWEIEHRVLLLDFRFWPGLARALLEADHSGVASYFDSQAELETIAEPGTGWSSGPIRFENRSAAKSGHATASMESMTDHLLGLLGRFDSDRRLSIRTVFLSPADRDSMDGSWRGRLLLRAWGTAPDDKPVELVVEADFELASISEDVPDSPRWLRACRIVSESIRQSDEYLFADVTRDWGLDAGRFHDNWLQPAATPRVMTGGVFAADYDMDGRSDLFITDVNGNVLYRRTGPGQFEDATWLAGLDSVLPSAAIAWADLDGDGFPDLIAENELFRNNQRGGFERAGALNVSNVNRIHGFAVADYDRDGLLDIYVTRLAPDPLETGGAKSSWLDDRTGPGNSLLRNLGNWKFEEVTEQAGADAGRVSCLSAVWFDANDDLWPDLFVGDEFGSPVLLVNRQNGTFESRTITGDFGGFNMGVSAGDLDQDGRTDLYLANMYSKAGERVLSNLDLNLYPPELARRIRHIVDGSELWHNRGDLQFESQGRPSGVARVGWSYGPRVADFDNDGMLDIYAPAGFISITRDEPDG